MHHFNTVAHLEILNIQYANVVFELAAVKGLHIETLVFIVSTLTLILNGYTGNVFTFTVLRKESQNSAHLGSEKWYI